MCTGSRVTLALQAFSFIHLFIFSSHPDPSPTHSYPLLFSCIPQITNTKALRQEATGDPVQLGILTLTWYVTLGFRFTVWDLAGLSPSGGTNAWDKQGPLVKFPLLVFFFFFFLPAPSPARSGIQSSLLHLTSALCLCFSSCWADFCLAFSTLKAGSLTLDFSFRAGGSMVWLLNASWLALT